MRLHEGAGRYDSIQTFTYACAVMGQVQPSSIKAFSGTGIDAALGAGAPSRSGVADPTEPVEASKAKLRTLNQGLWVPTSATLLNNKLTWSILSRAGVWDFDASHPVPGSVDTSMLCKQLLDRFEAADSLSGSAWQSTGASLRSSLISGVLQAFNSTYRGDEFAAGCTQAMSPGSTLFEATFAARKALLMLAFSSLPSQQDECKQAQAGGGVSNATYAVAPSTVDSALSVQQLEVSMCALISQIR